MTPEPTHVSATVDDLLAKNPRLKRLADLAPAEPTERTETEREAAERTLARQAVYRARWAAQVPPMYAQARLTDLDDLQAFTWPMESLHLVLAGPVGTGKTHAAYALGNALATDGLWVQAATVVDLLAAHRPDGDARLAQAARDAEVLIVDDLGATKATEWAVETLTALLDHRVRNERRTVVTTNVPEAELEAAWGGRFVDRLRHRRVVAVFKGPSRRKAAW